MPLKAKKKHKMQPRLLFTGNDRSDSLVILPHPLRGGIYKAYAGGRRWRCTYIRLCVLVRQLMPTRWRSSATCRDLAAFHCHSLDGPGGGGRNRMGGTTQVTRLKVGRCARTHTATRPQPAHTTWSHPRSPHLVLFRLRQERVCTPGRTCSIAVFQ